MRALGDRGHVLGDRKARVGREEGVRDVLDVVARTELVHGLIGERPRELHEIQNMIDPRTRGDVHALEPLGLARSAGEIELPHGLLPSLMCALPARSMSAGFLAASR